MQIPDTIIQQAEDVLLTLESQRSRKGRIRTIARALMRASKLEPTPRERPTLTVIDGGRDE